MSKVQIGPAPAVLPVDDDQDKQDESALIEVPPSFPQHEINTKAKEMKGPQKVIKKYMPKIVSQGDDVPCQMIVSSEVIIEEGDDGERMRKTKPYFEKVNIGGRVVSVPFNGDVRQRLFRFLSLTAIPLGTLVMLNSLTDGGQGSVTNWLCRILGIDIALMFTIYFINLFWQLYPGFNTEDDAYLFKVQTNMTHGIICLISILCYLLFASPCVQYTPHQ